MTITGSPPSAAELTAELRMPPAVAEWLAEQDPPPAQRPTSPGCHRLGEWHDLVRLPPGWPLHEKVQLPELHDSLYYDEYRVVRPVTNTGLRRHAARHTTAATA